jgi:hypothetical protein
MDHAMAIKRGHETATSDSGDRPMMKKVQIADIRKNSGVGKQVETSLPSVGKHQEPTMPLRIKERMSNPMDETTHEAKTEIKERIVEAKASSVQPSIIEDVVSQKVLQLSLNQLTSMSPSARTELKAKLTKKHRKKRSKQKMNALAISETPSHSVPRASVIINNMRVDAVLDGGSTVCIVSLKLVEMLGFSELESTNRSQGMADGRRIFALGVVRNLKIIIANKNFTMTDACVFDEPGYDLLLDRMTLARLRVGTDWDTNFWYIKTDIGTVPININYNEAKVKLPVRVEQNYDDSESDSDADSTVDSNLSTQDTVDSAYLIMLASDSESEDDVMTEKEQVLLISEANIESRVNAIRDELTIQTEKCDANVETKNELRRLLDEFVDVFGNSYYDLAQTNLVKFHVETGDAKPITKKPNGHLSYAECEMLRAELKEMLDHGVIIPTTHAFSGDQAQTQGWAFPVLYVKKKDGTKRLCVQFQALNDVAAKDPWPLPLITDVLESFRNAKVFSALDLLKGFNQIAVDERSIPKLTMTTQWGCFSYKAMPFGITNGSSAFSRAIYLALNEFVGDFVSTYIDDITVYSKNVEEHLVHLRRVFERLREVNMKLKTSKCEFMKTKVEILGFSVELLQQRGRLL